ncbi:MAG TPA: response regulator [Syntrophales bacterium]|nr:response regulator [Syntrophales bacterium]
MQQARVLIVDDEPLVRQALSAWLRRKHFHVVEAEGGRQAMEMIRKDEPDLVISDMVMPGMDGLRLLKEARAINAAVPFLMVTGYPSPSDASEAIKQGAQDYLAKPFKPEELTRRVNRMLLNKFVAGSHAPAKGIILGTSVSAILWALAIGALYAFFS